MKIALAMIVKGDDQEATLLDRCLETVAPHVDGIFITRTQPNEKIAKVVSKYNGVLSDFTWVNDFAVARNFNFSQVPKDFDYIIWCDADDVWRGLEKLKPTIEANPDVDAFGFWYMYDFDEYKKPTVVHKKTMVIKNDGCVEWAGALHEDFKENRQTKTFFVEGIERLHLTTDTRFRVAAKRNVEVSKQDVLNNPDDPRVYWNLANSLTSVDDYEGARTNFEKFLDVSGSDEEKFLVYLRLADIYEAQGDLKKSLEYHLIAIGAKPLYPDPYIQMGYYYIKQGQPEKGIDYILLGLPKKPAYHSIIAYNPRDYDYNPMLSLAKAYIQINRPDAALIFLKGCLKIYPDHTHLKPLVKQLEEESARLTKVLETIGILKLETDKEKIKYHLNKIPKDLRSHPAISNLLHTYFIRETSGGKDIAFYCGYTEHEWNPEIYRTKGYGGSEEAVYYLSREFAKLGWNVTVYNNCGTEEITDVVCETDICAYCSFHHTIRFGGCKQERKHGIKNKVVTVTYKPFWEYNPKDKWDKLIVWRHPKMLDYNPNATEIYLDLHDVLPAKEFTPKRLEKINKIFVKSQAHRVLFPNVPDEKFVVVPNGLDLSLFWDEVKKDPYLLINTSSPDRSMDVLPELFKRVKAQVPEAKLKWAYGWGIFDKSNTDKKDIEWKNSVIKACDDAGIEMLGKLNPEQVAKLYMEASILAYPTEFYEIDCISVRKAQLAGCIPVTSDFAALETTNERGIKVHSTKTLSTWGKKLSHGLEDPKAQDEWVEAVVRELKRTDNKVQELERSVMKIWAREYGWSKIAQIWNDAFAH